MHPPLYRPHPDCQQFIKALVECHEKHSIGKFFGSCNLEKVAIDKCFAEEKRRKQSTNRILPRDSDGFSAYLEEYRKNKREGKET